MYSQITPLTREQYREIYRKLPKKDLIEMLIESNRALEAMTPVLVPQQPCSPCDPIYPWTICKGDTDLSITEYK